MIGGIGPWVACADFLPAAIRDRVDVYLSRHGDFSQIGKAAMRSVEGVTVDKAGGMSNAK